MARPTLFLLCSFPGLTGDPDPCDETPSLHWPCNTRLVLQGFFAIGDPSLEVVSCPRFDMAPITRRSMVWEKELFKWLPEFVENTWCWINTESDSTHLSRNFLYLECLQVSFWCQHIWFGFWVPSWSYQNNLSRATLWVLDTCLIVGLRPLIVILITASLSSKMYNWDSPWEERVLVGTRSTSLNWSTPYFSIDMLGLGFGITNCQLGLNILKFPWASLVGLDLPKFPWASVTRLNVVLGCT